MFSNTNKKNKINFEQLNVEALTTSEQNDIKGGSSTSQNYTITLIQP